VAYSHISKVTGAVTAKFRRHIVYGPSILAFVESTIKLLLNAAPPILQAIKAMAQDLVMI
jgi:hypothetical protein